MIYILIATTALNRPILHNKTIHDWSTWISNLDEKKYEIIWFINIDIIEKLPFTFNETKNNFKNIINKKINNIFYFLNEKGNFLKACQTLVINIEKYIIDNNLIINNDSNNIKIFWLEDDWKFNINTNLILDDIITKYSFPRSFLNFSFIRNNYIWALSPSLISYKLWKDLHYECWINQKEQIDSEHCLGLWYKKKYNSNIENIYNLTIINKQIDLDYFKQPFLNNKYSFFSYYDNSFNIFVNNKYFNVLQYDFETNIFIRISPSICIDGVNYGRDFMKKFYLSKSHKQDFNNTNFYIDL